MDQSDEEEYDTYLKRKEIEALHKKYNAVIKINKILESYLHQQDPRNNSKTKANAKKSLLSDLEKVAVKALTHTDAELSIYGDLIHEEHKVFLDILAQKRRKQQGDDREDFQNCSDVKFDVRLTRKEIIDVIIEWIRCEQLSHNLVNHHSGDDDCKIMFQDLVNDFTAESLTKYMYRMKDDIEGKIEGEGEDEEELWGQTLLHLAVCFRKTETAKEMVTAFPPEIIYKDTGNEACPKESPYYGLTRLHIAIAHGEKDLVRAMINKLKEDTQWNQKKISKGTRTDGTVFMGQLPLHTAVLSCINGKDTIDTGNQLVEIINILIKDDKLEKLQKGNDDTVLHSIMHFVNCFPANETRAVDMMKYLEKIINDGGDRDNLRKRKLIFAKDVDNKTALQLATEYGLSELFKHLLQLQGVYYIVLPHDELYEIRRFDVTEFDKVAMVQAAIEDREGKKKTREERAIVKQQSVSDLLCGLPIPTIEDREGKKKTREERAIFKQQSVSALLCGLPIPIGTKFIQADVFEELIERKEKKYNLYWVVFLCLHFSLLIVFCVFVVGRAHADTGNPWPLGEHFIKGCHWLTLLCSIFYLSQEAVRIVLSRQPMFWTATHHNAAYRILLVLYGVFLLLDFILYRANASFDDRSIFLICAIVVGTWSLFFFLRRIPLISIYVVHINEGLIRAVLPFSSLIILQLLIFSACMHSAFLQHETNRTVVQFESYVNSVLTMAKLMFGLTEIERLLESRQKIIAIMLFVVFLIITFLLMIQALIGVLTNRFRDTTTNKRMVWMIQRLSIIIFFEGWFVCTERIAKSCVVKRVGRNVIGDLDNKKKHLDILPEENSQNNGGNREISEPQGVRYVMSYRKVSSKMMANLKISDRGGDSWWKDPRKDTFKKKTKVY